MSIINNTVALMISDDLPTEYIYSPGRLGRQYHQ